MLQQDSPDDFVLATGETHEIGEFVRIAFEHVGLDWEKHVVIDPRYYRPAEVDLLVGNPEKATKVLGWEHTVSFEELVKLMVDADLAKLETTEPNHTSPNYQLVETSTIITRHYMTKSNSAPMAGAARSPKVTLSTICGAARRDSPAT